MTRYKVVSATQLEELEKQVNNLLANGWKLQGGVSVGVGNSYFYQAMAK
jgi:hypothetical protein